jgi:hypothetical protein
MNGICGIRIPITPLQGLSFGSLPNRRALPYAIDFGFSTQGSDFDTLSTSHILQNIHYQCNIVFCDTHFGCRIVEVRSN